MLTISTPTLDIGDLRSHEIDTPGVYAVFASERPTQPAAEPKHPGRQQRGLPLVDPELAPSGRHIDKQEILLIDEGAYKLRGWSSFKDWFLPVLEAKIDFTQPIYAPKKASTAPRSDSDAAKAIKATPNLPTDVSQLIELITTTNAGSTSTLNKLYPIYQQVGGTKTPPSVIDTQDHEAKLFAAFRKKYPHVLDLHRGDGTSVGAPAPVRLGRS